MGAGTFLPDRTAGHLSPGRLARGRADAPEPLTAAGKDLGLWSIASTLPAVIAPLIGSLLIAAADRVTHQIALGYRAVFGLAAVCLLLGAVFVLRIREAPGHAIPAPYLPS